MSENMPAAELEVTAPLVARLIETQVPELADQPVTFLASGWDNFLFAIGHDHVARLPRRQMAVSLVENESTWLPQLAPLLPLPIPAPLFSGRPGDGYPWPWTVTPFIPGSSVADSDVDLRTCAEQLGEFLAALHQPSPRDAPTNPYRGGPLAERDRATRERISSLAEEVDDHGLTVLWEKLVRSEAYQGPPLWLHGDLHPHNLLAQDRRLSGVVDFGDITGGDPATDLAVAWTMFTPETRPAFWDSYGDVAADTVQRARGWALSLGLAYLSHSADNQTMAAIGRHALAQVGVES